MLGSSLVPVLAALLSAQQPAFLHTITPGGARALVSADLGYGERLFAGIGPERWEQRLGAQLALGSRLTLVASGGFTRQNASGAVEVLASVLPRAHGPSPPSASVACSTTPAPPSHSAESRPASAGHNGKSPATCAWNGV